MSGSLETTFDRQGPVPEPPYETEPAEEEQFDEPDSDDRIDEPSLLAALENFKSWRSSPRGQRILAALSAAILIHAALIGVCLALAFKMHVFAPRLQMARGPAGSEGDLVTNSDPADSSQEEHSMPGPSVPMPAPEKTTLPPEPERIEMSDPQAPSDRQTRLDGLEGTADPLLFGIQADPVGASPHWHSARPVPVGGSVGPAVQHAAAHVVAAGPARPAAPVHHAFVPPRGAGRGGGGDQNVDYDERGIPVPDYPAESYRRREEGIVELQVLVRPDGSVGEANVIKSSSFPRLDQAALTAIRVARFSPGTRDGTPVAMQVVVPFRFTLRE